MYDCKVEHENSEEIAIVEALQANRRKVSTFKKALIEHVRQSPIIWNSLFPDYRNREKKAATWEKIGIALKKPANDCRKQWTRMRENYIRCKNPANTTHKADVWPYFASMDQFLAPFSSFRASKSHEQQTQQQQLMLLVAPSPIATSTNTAGAAIEMEAQSDAGGSGSDFADCEEDVVSGSVASSSAPVSAVHSQKRKRERHSSGDCEEDQDAIFGRYVTASLKKLPTTRQKALAKLKIQQALYEVETAK